MPSCSIIMVRSSELVSTAASRACVVSDGEYNIRGNSFSNKGDRTPWAEDQSPYMAVIMAVMEAKRKIRCVDCETLLNIEENGAEGALACVKSF